MKSFDANTTTEHPEPCTSSRSGDRRPQFLSDLVVCLSMANIVYLRVWTELLTFTPPSEFRMRESPQVAEYVAIMANVLLLALTFVGGVTIIRRRPRLPLRVLSYLAFLVGSGMCANAVRTVIANYFDFLRGSILRYINLGQAEILVAALGIIGVTVLITWMRPIVRAAYRGFIMLSPFVALTFGQATLAIAKHDQTRFADGPPAAAAPVKPGLTRIVWMIFDELDQRLAYEARPEGLALPELDRLRSESFYATAAYSPATATRYSLPAMIEGRMALEDSRKSATEVWERFEGDSAPARWEGKSSVFAGARALGLNTGVVGWYLPYCRILNGVLTKCWWCEMESQMNSMGDGFAESVQKQARSLFETSLLSPFGQSLLVQFKVRHYQEMTAEAMSMAADPSIGLSMLHLDVPHQPHIYDRSSGTLSRANSPVSGYADSMALADLTLGRIRRAMEQSGVWESTAVLVTSDHGFRYANRLDGKLDMRVPFVLKLPGSSRRFDYGDKFNTVITKEMLLAIVRGEITTAENAASWLGPRRRAVGPVF